MYSGKDLLVCSLLKASLTSHIGAPKDVLDSNLSWYSACLWTIWQTGPLSLGLDIYLTLMWGSLSV